MRLEIFSELADGLAESVKRFIAENFYAEGGRTPELLEEEAEKFYSQPKAWLLAFEEEQLRGTTALHQRKIQFHKKDMVLGGIGRVCVRKDQRRQGIAALMLEEALNTLREWGCDIAYLCANIRESGDLYAKVGFVPLNKPYTYNGQSGKLYEEINGMIAPVNSPNIFEAILRSEEKLHLGPGNW
jgi:GNAT superfamily N-acetyltransferase